MSFQTFETIIGHDNNLNSLRGAISSGKISHSHLFHGPKGVGKASVANAFAQIVLCKNRLAESVTSCGHCSSCQKMVAGQHPDFFNIEMEEGKTRISIDQIRELGAFLSLTPMESPWKVALIDDAAQMNAAAANALLKTLEEPPEQSILIINTYRPGALLPTIRSRCNKSRFSGLNRDALVAIVNKLVDTDRETIDNAVALAGGDVALTVSMCSSGVIKERDRFFSEITDLATGTLATVCSMAEFWSKVDRFATIMLLLKAWFQEQIHVSLRSQAEPSSIREWLALAQWAEELMARSTVVNLNRRLVLEALFIKVARLRKATF